MSAAGRPCSDCISIQSGHGLTGTVDERIQSLNVSYFCSKIGDMVIVCTVVLQVKP